MAGGHLLRGHAPISDAGWKLIDEEAKARLTPGLAARRLVDFAGPRGWEHSATNLGRVGDQEISPLEHVEGRVRRVLPLVEAALEVCEAAGAPHYAAKVREQRDAIRAKLVDGTHL